MMKSDVRPKYGYNLSNTFFLKSEMVRRYIRKTDRLRVTFDDVSKAIRKVSLEKQNLSRVSTEMSISRRTLARYVAEAKKRGFDLSQVSDDESVGRSILGEKYKTVFIVV
jgi:predicted ABC-type ATPase